MNVTTQPQPKATLTLTEAAARIGISMRTAYAAAKSGAIPTVKLGNSRYVPAAHLDRMLGLVA